MRPPGMAAAKNAEYTSRPTPLRRRSSARAAYPERCSQPARGRTNGHTRTDTALDNDQFQTFAAAHLGLGDPARAEHTYMSAPPSKHPTARAPDGARLATRWTAGPQTSTPPASPGRQGSREGTTASATGYTARPPEQASSPTANTPLPSAVLRGLIYEQRKALDAASAAALHCEAGGG
jgi:hypothetical protein